MRSVSTRVRGWATTALVAFAAVLCGCGGGTSTDPDDSPSILFTPTAQGQQLAIGQEQAFEAGREPEGSMTVTWRRGGVVVGDSRSFNYLAEVVGRDTLRAHAEAGIAVRDYFWVIDVAPEPLTAPAIVPNVAVVPGADPVQVLLSWTRVSNSIYPLVDYIAVVSYTGQVTAENWDAAQVLGSIAHVPGQVGYSTTWDRANGGLLPGAEAWFAVRARDDRGQLSTAVANRYTRITTEWWIDGRVLDDTGEPLLGIIVSSAVPLRNDNTDGDGIFRLGPYRSIDSVAVRTTSIDYYDFTTARLGSAIDVDLELVLPYRYGIAAECTGYDNDFLTYFRAMTNTNTADDDTSASRLWKWDHWPLSVYLPDSTLATGRPMDDLAREMLALWNQTMGETYLVETPSAAAADVHFAWVTDASAGYGEAALEVPVGGVLGEVIPQRVRVEVETGILTDKFFSEVALHEFGHVLGLVDHALFCTAAGHLMVLGASGNLSLPNPIHPDEVRAVRTVRRLRQGTDMRRFEP